MYQRQAPAYYNNNPMPIPGRGVHSDSVIQNNRHGHRGAMQNDHQRHYARESSRSDQHQPPSRNYHQNSPIYQQEDSFEEEELLHVNLTDPGSKYSSLPPMQPMTATDPDHDMRYGHAQFEPDIPVEKIVFMRFCDDQCKCPPCTSFRTCFELLSAKYGQASFFDASVKSNGQAVRQLKIDHLPTVVAFKGRREIGRFAGDNVEQLEKFVHTKTHKI